jgi:hypothetical protein
MTAPNAAVELYDSYDATLEVLELPDTELAEVAVNEVISLVAPTIAGASTTSSAIATGSKVFTVPSGLALQIGDFVRLASRANGANYMAGNITAYAGTSITINVTEIGGTGTFADWNLNLTGVKGQAGSTGATAVISGTSATSFVPATGSKVFVTQAGIPAFTVGQYVRIASASNPGDYMAGNVTAYTTTSLTVNVLESAGATARTDWNISLSGTRGAQGIQGTIGNTGPVPTISGTSATSFTPSVGSKVFATQAGMALTVGQYVRIASAAVPTDYMSGAITAYSGTSLTVNVDAFSGITARTDWNISITGTTGAQGPVGAGAADATTTSKGSIQLAGDLAGTAAAPTVVAFAGTGPNSLVRRDASGNAVFNQLYAGSAQDTGSPSAYTRKDYVDALGTAAATADTVMRRDASANVNVRAIYGTVAPDAVSALTRKDYVDALGTDAATANTVVRRDVGANFSANVIGLNTQAQPSHATRKDYVDSRDQWTPQLKTGAAYTFALADETNHILGNDTVAQTYTIPTNATVAFPLGAKIQVTRWNTGTLTLAAAAGVTLNAVNANRSLNQYESCVLIKVATDSWLIVNLATAASTTVSGIVRLATTAEATAQASAAIAVTPAGLADRAKVAGGITTIQQITQAAYTALGTKDAATLYVIVG